MKYIKLFLGVLLCVLAFGTLAACGKGNSQLKTPKNLRLIDEVLVWDEVEGAEKYLVNFDGEDYITETNSFDIFELVAETKTYHMSVMALGNSETTFHSEFSEEFVCDLQLAQGLSFSLLEDETGYEVKGDKEAIKGRVVIPVKYNGLPVKEIRWAGFSGCSEMTDIILPSSLVKISSNAFKNCTGLTQIKIPGVENLWRCLNGCSNLTAVMLSSEIKQIDSLFTFSGCVNLTSITMDGEGDYYAVDGNCIIRKVDNVLVAGCKKSVIPDYIERIADNAFQGCESLGDITIPYGVKSIGNEAFEDCLGLTSVKIPDSVTTIGNNAFSCCFDLSSVVIPASVEKIDSRAFEFSGTLYVPFETAPAGWGYRWAEKDPKWYYDGVVFGCKLAYENHYPYVESFTFDASAEIATFSSDLVAPNRTGYTFLGWATEPGGEVKFGVENGRIHYDQMNYWGAMPGVGGYKGYTINGVLYEQYDKDARITLPLSVRKTITNGTTLYAVYEKIE